MNLEHPEFKPFEPFLRQVLDIAFNSGTKTLQSKGFRFDDIKTNDTALKVFIRGCHYGYDKAQRRIGEEVIKIDGQIRREEQTLKDIRRQRIGDAKDIILRIRILRERQLTLRRIIDTMVYSIVAPDEWQIRRLGDNVPRSIDSAVLNRMLRVARVRNESSRYNFYVVSDLTTLVHIGDLLEVRWAPGEGKQWKLIELKEGRVNSLLSQILDGKSSLDKEETEQIEQTLGKDAVKQAQRMLRQNESRSQLEKLLATDRGIDFGTKQELILSSEVTIVDSYEQEVSKIVEAAKQSGYAATSVDGCLHLIAVKGDLLPRGKHALIPMLHLLSHSAKHDALPAEETLLAEWKNFEATAPVVDIVRLSMGVPCSHPVFSWLLVSPSNQIDLALGRIRVIAYFDLETFLGKLNGEGIKYRWISGKEADDIRKLSPRIPGSPNAHGLRVELPSGTSQVLMNGFFSRVFLYLTKPTSLLSMIKNFDKDKAEIESRHLIDKLPSTNSVDK